MHPPQLVVLGYSEAAQFLRQTDPRLLAGIISIHGTNESGLSTHAIPRLDLLFNDIDAPPKTDPIATYHARQTRLAHEAHGLRETPPTPDDARAIIDFARTLAHKGGILLIHCGAGMSRSPAAALLCLATWHGPGRENWCVEELLRIRSHSIPHESLVRFGDQILDRRGQLLQALQSARQQGRLLAFRPAPKPNPRA
jgi:predicted protein tyrosine phosphatase